MSLISLGPHLAIQLKKNEFDERVRNPAKSCFTVATNAHVQLLYYCVTTAVSTHLTVGGSKVTKIHKTTDSCFN